MAQPEFVHLRLHSEYALADSIIKVKPLIARARELGMAALALTDRANLFALVKFYRKACASGIKPLVGVDLKLRDAAEPGRSDGLVLLCQNQAGYRNLTRLITRSYIEGQQRGVPMAEREWLTRDTCRGLIALSGCLSGRVSRALSEHREADAEAHREGDRGGARAPRRPRATRSRPRPCCGCGDRDAMTYPRSAAPATAPPGARRACLQTDSDRLPWRECGSVH